MKDMSVDGDVPQVKGPLEGGYFYGEEPPSFEEILGRLTELETEINNAPATV